MDRASNVSVSDVGIEPGMGQRGAWAGVVVATGIALGLLETVHFLRMLEIVGPLGVVVEAVLPMILSGALSGIGVWLYCSEYRHRELRRIVGWMAIGAASVGILFVWSLSHQYVAGEEFHHAGFVLGTNLVVGTLLGTVVGLYDVRTQRHRREAEIERTAAARERTKLAFLNRELRHHVLNSINVVQGQLDLAEQGDVDVTDVEQYVDEAGETVQRIGTVTRALDPQTTNNLGSRDLTATVRREVDRLRACRPGTTVETEIQDGVTVQADELLPSVVENLLSNAVQHNDRERPWVRVSLTADRDGATLLVADDGPGIDETTRRVLAEWAAPSSDGASPVVDDTSPAVGIGFAMVGTAVDRYGGAVRIEDREPRGSVMVLVLPTTAEEPIEERGDASTPS